MLRAKFEEASINSMPLFSFPYLCYALGTMDIIGQVKKFVREESDKPTSKYGAEPFEFHFTPVANYAAELADELGGDKEVILIAAWMHDIGAIIVGRKDHHVTGADIAEKKLKELDYSAEKITMVKACILHHRGSQDFDHETIEEQIVAEADAMSQFDNIAGIFKAAFMYENLNQGDAKVSVREKLQRKWSKLHFEKSKEIVRPKYEAAMILLQ